MAVGQIAYKVRLADGTLYSSSNLNGQNPVGQNLVTLANIGENSFKRVGIQAPAGTKALINELQTIVIGRTGIYELETKITSLKILPTQTYEVVSSDESGQPTQELNNLKTVVANLNTVLQNTSSTKEQCKTAIETFNSAYPEKVSAYLSAAFKSVVATGTKPVENIIVDYEY